MKKDFVKYIKKLRLVKDRQYILFIPEKAGLNTKDLEVFSEILQEHRYYVLIADVKTTDGIKVVEEET